MYSKSDGPSQGHRREGRDVGANGNGDVEKQPAAELSEPDTPLYQPKTLGFWLIIVSTFLAMFLVALDRTIVSTAIPRITDDFKSLGDIGWYGSAYMLTSSASQLVFGRIYRVYNMKWCEGRMP